MKTFNYRVKNEVFEHYFLENDENTKILIYLYLKKYLFYKKDQSIIIRTDKRKSFLFPHFNEYFKKFNYDISPIVKNNDVDKFLINDFKLINKLFEDITEKIKKNLNKIKDVVFASMFITYGYINDPKSNFYHFEFNFRDLEDNEEIKLFNKIKMPEDIQFKKMIANTKSVFYVKKASMIADLLKYLHCFDALIEFEDVRIERDFVSLYKKINSIDIYNIQKISSSSFYFNQKIKELIQTKKINKLETKYRQIAYLRYENPDISLLELSNKYNIIYKTNFSKSTIFRWLKFITK